ncbi:oxidoreductase [Rhizorhabdus wittichii DC-6]|uniref:Gfo/Idh/MocA family oxidoreductase n=1 Tax=Rhizorhabdus wittichii TaxID=160791 RepID=A0A975HC87_9SPHN|nr:Gfo/Idh/MocA family oxidoreductase [Rhizorhabdus wittichii]ARR53661.1 oxidoreductase [Rhizorhabdus wittichii DC-6]QTH19977.1 Gfo/Idh/MocA family oxidoreductase [Rhizorhabdus wittichii]
MTPPLRFAVVGRGRMAATMRALVGDVDEAEADAVYIAGRNRDHAARSLAALAAGKAVLCEKPATMSAAEAEAVVAQAQRVGRLYMEAVATPFLPAVAMALAAARSGRIGALTHVEASFGYRVRRADHPRLFEADGGVLADRAVYPLMLALIALGPVRAMRCTVDRDAAGLDVAARLELDHAGGGVSDLAVSFTRRLDNSLRIAGDAGAVEVQPPLLTAQRLRFTGPGRAGPPPLWRHARQNPLVRRLGDLGSRGSARWHPFGASPYLHEIEHFAALHRAGAIESPVVSHARTIEVARLVEQARRA